MNSMFVIEMQDDNPLVFYSIVAGVRVNRNCSSGKCNHEVASGITGGRQNLGQRDA